jgi:hypothetical protein
VAPSSIEPTPKLKIRAQNRGNLNTMKNPEANRRQQRARRKRLYAINSAIVREDKRLGCSFCPRKNLPPEMIHHDHLDPKAKRDCI